MEGVSSRVRVLLQKPLNPEFKVVFGIVAEALPIQDELDYARMNGGREKTRVVYVKSTINLVFYKWGGCVFDVNVQVFLVTTINSRKTLPPFGEMVPVNQNIGFECFPARV